MFKTTVTFRDVHVEAGYIVIEGPAPCMLSYGRTKALDIAHVICEGEESANINADPLFDLSKADGPVDLAYSVVNIFRLKIFHFPGIASTEDQCQALRDAKELRSLLGVIQYSGRFIRDLSTEAASLWRLLKPGVEWLWMAVEQAAFDKIKKSLSSKCLAFFDKTWLTEVIVDASPQGLVAVLMQINPNDKNERRVVCFASRFLTDVETRYSQCEKEAIAAVWGCERYCTYLFGKKFSLVS